MKIRSTLHLGPEAVQSQIYALLSETYDHLCLKLAAQIFFHGQHPLIISSPQQHDALAGQDFAPDLMAVDDTLAVRLWLECGKTTANKLSKITKKFREARIVMLLAQPHEAKQMAETLQADNNNRVEVWTFQTGEFARWRGLVTEQNDIVGEATETSMNLVINAEMFMTDLRRVR